MSTGRLAKPQLRDLHLTYVKRSVLGLVLFIASVGISYRVLITNVHEKRVEEFYKTYDPEKSLEKMNAAGLMQSSSD